MTPPMLYTFYGDDFTGSSDVLEQLANGGVRSALFLQPPTPEDLALIPNLQAIGIAGDSRSQSPAWMSAHLPAIFQHLRSFNAPITHYKVCSTFDSSPTTGSIGRALELGQEAFNSPFVPIVVGAPHLKRFVSGGHLFAVDPSGFIHRIDRHPMARHPITPMRESSLVRHLASQSTTRIANIHHDRLHTTPLLETIQAQLSAHNRAILFDTLDTRDLETIGKALWPLAQQQPLFAVGSSGLTTALISAWQALNLIDATHPFPTAQQRPRTPLLVVSGSCAAATARQIKWALAHNFHGLHIDPSHLLDPSSAPAFQQATAETTTTLLAEGKDVILYTANGSPTSTLEAPNPATPSVGSLGTALGQLLTAIASRFPLHRLLLCGGDTSSHAVQQLNLRALTWQANLQTGAPLCRAHAPGLNNNLELVLKGGQVGTDTFFATVRDA